MKWILPLLLISSSAGAFDYKGPKREVTVLDQQLLVGTTEPFNVSGSTLVLQGSDGSPITSESVTGGEALMVINKGATNLSGLTFVYTSTSNFVVGSTMTFIGLAGELQAQAFGGYCDIKIDDGASIRISTDTERTFPMGFLILSPDVFLKEKSSPATCTAFISGAN